MAADGDKRRLAALCESRLRQSIGIGGMSGGAGGGAGGDGGGDGSWAPGRRDASGRAGDAAILEAFMAKKGYNLDARGTTGPDTSKPPAAAADSLCSFGVVSTGRCVTGPDEADEVGDALRLAHLRAAALVGQLGDPAQQHLLRTRLLSAVEAAEAAAAPGADKAPLSTLAKALDPPDYARSLYEVCLTYPD